jgi:hypothetical protein
MPDVEDQSHRLRFHLLAQAATQIDQSENPSS